MPTRTPLTDEQIWAILNAPAEMNSRQIADQLGITYSAAHQRRWQLRKHPWTCRVEWKPCAVCGYPLIRPTSRKRYHDQCAPLAKRQWHQEHESLREYTDEQLQARDERRDDHYQRTQATTLPRATSHYRRYTPEDDAQLLKLSETMTLEEVALEVGRTMAAVQTRLRVVKAREAS